MCGSLIIKLANYREREREREKKTTTTTTKNRERDRYRQRQRHMTWCWCGINRILMWSVHGGGWCQWNSDVMFMSTSHAYYVHTKSQQHDTAFLSFKSLIYKSITIQVTVKVTLVCCCRDSARKKHFRTGNSSSEVVWPYKFPPAAFRQTAWTNGCLLMFWFIGVNTAASQTSCRFRIFTGGVITTSMSESLSTHRLI